MKAFNNLVLRFIILVAICYALPIFIFAAVPPTPIQTTVDGVTYTLNLDNRTATVTKAPTKIKSIKLDEGVVYEGRIYEVVSIGRTAFSQCSELSDIVLPPYLKTIESFAFNGCESLSNLKIPETVNKIDSAAFQNCKSLKEVTIPQGVGNIGPGLFIGCDLLEEASIECHSNITKMMFRYCVSLKTVNIKGKSASLSTRIGESAFENCKSLNTISLPSNVSMIDKAAFKGCESLTEFTVPSRVDKIDESTFEGCISLNKIVIGDRCLGVSTKAFWQCENLKEINWNNKLTYIGENAFTLCKSIKSICLPKSLKVIDKGAFSGCSELEEIEIGDSLNKVYSGAFYDCTSLKRIRIPNLETWCSIIFENSNANPCYPAKGNLYISGTLLENITIPDTITEIRDRNFLGCSSIKNVVLNKKVTKIGELAFSECENLEKVTINTSKTFIGWKAFANCRKLSDFYVYSKIAPLGYNQTINDDVFCGSSPEYMNLHIPKECYANYHGIFIPFDGWGRFGNTIEDLIIEPITKITLPTQIVLYINTGHQLEAIIEPDVPYELPVKWEKELADYIILKDDGFVLACSTGYDSPGKNTVIVSSVDNPDINASCDVIVYKYASGINLSDTELILTKGCSGKLHAFVHPTNANPNVSWASNDEKVATVDESGTVTAIGVGKCIITAVATDGSGVKATCEITVNPALVESISLDPAEWICTKGQIIQVNARMVPANADDLTLTWSSGDVSVATVNNDGLVTAVGIGECVITASAADGSGVSACCSVTVKPVLVESISLDPAEWICTKGQSLQVNARILPANADDLTLTWSSGDESVATVNSDGLVTAIGIGECIITASAADGSGVSASCSVIVKPVLVESISLDPAEWSGFEGEIFQINAIITPDEAENKTIEWTSSDISIATVDNNGLVNVIKDGSCIISARTTDGSDLSAECIITSISGIDNIFTDADESFDIYNVHGLLIKKDCNRDNLKNLSSGIYIIRQDNKAKKIIVK